MLNLDEYHRKDVGPPRMEEHFELPFSLPSRATWNHTTRDTITSVELDVSFRDILLRRPKTVVLLGLGSHIRCR